MDHTGGNCTSGYTCPTCGLWVSYGYFHQCNGVKPALPQIQFVPYPAYSTTDQEIIAKLREINEKLDKVLARSHYSTE